ncbi:MAG: hypothetical protein M1836_006146 [Candelina mexicana]|nr:MAG: hypothetical protein M1836_006146 [Candelina mexicana]
MAEPVSTKSSRWGSFLQQAAAGIESRLDTILADEIEASPSLPKINEKTSAQPSRRTGMLVPPSTHASDKAEKGLARTPSNSKTNDRLQDRLAKAVVNRNGTQSNGSLTLSSGEQPRKPSIDGLGISRSSSNIRDIDFRSIPLQCEQDSAKSFTDNRTTEPSSSNDRPADTKGELPRKTPDLSLLASTSEPNTSSQLSTDETSSEYRGSRDSGRDVSISSELRGIVESTNVTDSTAMTFHEYEALIAQMQSDYEVSELRRQDEVHSYIERIDALHAKLQYLSKETVESAKTATSSAQAGSVDQKLSAKEQQIALLMDEGAKLSKSELAHISTIKKLRAKAIADEKGLLEARRRQEKAEKDAAAAREEARGSEAMRRRVEDRVIMLSRIENEFENLKAEKATDHSKIRSLKAELTQAVLRAETAEERIHQKAMQAESETIAGLREDLSSTKLEKEIGEDKLRAEIRNLKENLNQEKDRAARTELELRGEHSVLESKMEALRARAEEVSTGAAGDVQAKLLRQIETLQTQYAIASENWRGIEGTLLSRVRDLEKEKDEISKRESDVRRKAREASTKFKRSQEELGAVLEKSSGTDEELIKLKDQLEKLQRRFAEAQANLLDMKKTHERDKQTWESDYLRRTAEEKTRWREEPIQAQHVFQQPRGGSPVASHLRGSTVEYFGAQSRRFPNRSSSTDVSISATDRPLTSRALGQPSRTPDAATPPRQETFSYFSHPPIDGSIPETPSVQHVDNDDFFDDVETPSSPHRTINDMISVSTVGAGPSVQLVERMSSAVRRLESERASTKEELIRLSKQRDEARKEVVELMHEAEQKRLLDQKVQKLEGQMLKMNDRYQTTLEMLGEKSELVEELRADVADVKKIYRELVDSTMR